MRCEYQWSIEYEFEDGRIQPATCHFWDDIFTHGEFWENELGGKIKRITISGNGLYHLNDEDSPDSYVNIWDLNNPYEIIIR
jgi:uncharacterized surface anchored protein